MTTVTNDQLRTNLAALKYYICGVMTASPRKFRYWHFDIPDCWDVDIHVEVGRVHTADYKIKIRPKGGAHHEWVTIYLDDAPNSVIDQLQKIGGFKVWFALDTAVYKIAPMARSLLSEPPLDRGCRPGSFYFQDEYESNNAGRLPM